MIMFIRTAFLLFIGALACANPGSSSTMGKAISPTHMDELMSAAALRLSKEDMAELNEASAY